MYYNPQRARRRFPFIRIIVLLIVIGGIGFFVYKLQTGNVVSVSAHPTLVIEQCTGSVHIHAGSANDQIIFQGLGGIVQFYGYDKASNTITVQDCNGLDVVVPANSDLKIDADSIDVIGVSGQMSLTTNGSAITLIQDTLTGNSTLDNNGGVTRFDGSIDAKAKVKFSANGGSIDITVPRNASFHLDVTGIIETITSDFPGVRVQGNELHTDVGQPPYTAVLTLDVNGSPIVMK